MAVDFLFRFLIQLSIRCFVDFALFLGALLVPIFEFWASFLRAFFAGGLCMVFASFLGCIFGCFNDVF